MRLWRSLLFVPANQKRMLDKLGSLPADGFIFDLEDTVPPPEKANARAMTKEAIATIVGNKSWVRVNSVPSGFLHEDLETFVGMPGLAGFVVPKQDSYGDVAAVVMGGPWRGGGRGEGGGCLLEVVGTADGEGG